VYGTALNPNWLSFRLTSSTSRLCGRKQSQVPDLRHQGAGKSVNPALFPDFVKKLPYLRDNKILVFTWIFSGLSCIAWLCSLSAGALWQKKEGFAFHLGFP